MEQSVTVDSWKCSCLLFSCLSYDAFLIYLLSPIKTNIYICKAHQLLKHVSSGQSFKQEFFYLKSTILSLSSFSLSATMGSIFRFNSHFQSPGSAHWLIFSGFDPRACCSSLAAGGDRLLYILLSVIYQDTKSYPFIFSPSHSNSNVCAAL